MIRIHTIRLCFATSRPFERMQVVDTGLHWPKFSDMEAVPTSFAQSVTVSQRPPTWLLWTDKESPLRQIHWIMSQVLL